MKKGQFFMLIMVVVTLIGFSAAYIVMRAKTGEEYNEPIGTRQMAVIKANAEMHRALAYIDLSAVLAEDQAELELAKNGGHYERPCGDYGGYSLWNNNSKLCVPKSQDSYLKFFDDIMAEYIVRYQEIFIPSYNYIYSIAGDVLSASSVLPLSREITDQDLVTVDLVSQPAKIIGDFAWPSSTDTVITSCLGPRNVNVGSSDHQGIDLRAKVGSPIYAIARGKVTKVDDLRWGEVKIEHENGLETRILHSSAILVSEEQYVDKGQVIARAGNKAPAGTNVAVHIHFEARKDGNLIDPIESIFSIEDFGIKFTKSSNCYYNSQNYAYKDKVLANVEGLS